jgi:hypothetical protein
LFHTSITLHLEFNLKLFVFSSLHSIISILANLQLRMVQGHVALLWLFQSHSNVISTVESLLDMVDQTSHSLLVV